MKSRRCYSRARRFRTSRTPRTADSRRQYRSMNLSIERWTGHVQQSGHRWRYLSMRCHLRHDTFVHLLTSGVLTASVPRGINSSDLLFSCVSAILIPHCPYNSSNLLCWPRYCTADFTPVLPKAVVASSVIQYPRMPSSTESLIVIWGRSTDRAIRFI